MNMTYLEQLRETALDQHGMVTTPQALGIGVPAPELSKMVARNRLTRVAHGVYRVPQVAETEYDSYQLAVFWTGESTACLSHETALAAWGISDINPDKIHLTLPKSKRLRRSGGEAYIVHYEDLKSDETTYWQGISMVTVPTAIRQCIEIGVPSYLIYQAFARASETSRLLIEDRDFLSVLLEVRDGKR